MTRFKKFWLIDDRAVVAEGVQFSDKTVYVHGVVSRYGSRSFCDVDEMRAAWRRVDISWEKDQTAK